MSNGSKDAGGAGDAEFYKRKKSSLFRIRKLKVTRQVNRMLTLLSGLFM
jgi:hypothetical protein